MSLYGCRCTIAAIAAKIGTDGGRLAGESKMPPETEGRTPVEKNEILWVGVEFALDGCFRLPLWPTPRLVCVAGYSAATTSLASTQNS